MFEMKNSKPETRKKKHENKKDISYPVNPLDPVHPVKKKMSNTTEIVTRISQMRRISAFTRLNAAVQTGGRSRSDGWSQPFRRVVVAVQTGERSRSHGCTALRRFAVAVLANGVKIMVKYSGGLFKKFFRAFFDGDCM
jgi:hypothetical protein